MGKFKPPEVKFWLDEAASCETRQRKELITRWNYPFLVHYYEGMMRINAQDPHVIKDQQLAVINDYFPSTNQLISTLMYKNPDIMAEAAKPEAEGGENLMKSALDYWFSRTDAIDENRIALFDMFAAGYCAVEVDYMAERDALDKLIVLPTEEELAEREQTGMQVAKNNIKKFVGKIANNEDAEKKLAQEGPEPESAFSTNESFGDGERTYIQRWNPLNVLFDWRAERLKFRRYSLKRILMSKAEFDKKYPEYKDKVGMGVDDRYGSHGVNLPFGRHNDQAMKTTVLLYEFQIKRGVADYWTLVVCPSYPLEEIALFKRPYTTNGFNMKIGQMHKYGAMYPVPMFQINKKMADEMNEYVMFLKETSEKSVPKIAYNQDKVKIDGIEALRSSIVNDLVPVEGQPNAHIQPVKPAIVSPENKELFALWKARSEKGWSVPETRMGGKPNVKFATELQVAEAGFEAQQIDIQQGLRQLIREELTVGKDIIAKFWDGETFFKITGGQKPDWYEAININGIVINPLTELLTADYFIDVDIMTSFKPNTDKERSDLVALLRELLGEGVMMTLQMQGRQISADFINKIVEKFGLNPENVFEEAPPPQPEGAMPGAEGAMPGAEGEIPGAKEAIAEGVPPEVIQQATAQGAG